MTRSASTLIRKIDTEPGFEICSGLGGSPQSPVLTNEPWPAADPACNRTRHDITVRRVILARKPFLDILTQVAVSRPSLANFWERLARRFSMPLAVVAR